MLFHCVKDVVCVHFCVPCFECIVDVVPYRPYLNVTIPSVLTSVLHTLHLYRASRYIFFYCRSVALLPICIFCVQDHVYGFQDDILPLTHCAAHDTLTLSNVKAIALEFPCHQIALEQGILFDNELAKFEYDASLR